MVLKIVNLGRIDLWVLAYLTCYIYINIIKSNKCNKLSTFVKSFVSNF